MILNVKLLSGLLVLLVVVTASLVALGRERNKPSQPISSQIKPSPSPTLTTIPSPSFIAPLPSRPPQPSQEYVYKPPSPAPKSKPSPTIKIEAPRSVSVAADDNQEAKIEFISLPSTLSGQSKTIQWRVVGPSGATGQDASIKITYKLNKSSGGSSSSVSTSSEQSFGSFTVPKTFSTNLSMSGEGTANIEISATVNGQTITTSRSIPLS